MTHSEFINQFNRLSAEWPRGYGASKQQMFARNFAGLNLKFFSKVIDVLLERFRFAPQVADVHGVIGEMRVTEAREKEVFKRGPEPEDPNDPILPTEENQRRMATLIRWMGLPGTSPNKTQKVLEREIFEKGSYNKRST